MASDIDALFDGLDQYYPGSKTKRKAIETPVKQKPVHMEGSWDSRPFIKLINGRERETFTLGALAAALERPVVTVRLWIRKGYIPQAPYRLPSKTLDDGRVQKGRRLYTRALIEATVSAFVERGLLGSVRVEWSEHRDLTIELLETWTRIYNQESGR